MDAVTAFATALAVTAAGGIAARRVLHAGAPEVSHVTDGAIWLEAHQRRVDAFATFTEPAAQIEHIVATWPVLPPIPRQQQRIAAYEHLQTLRRREHAMLDGGPDVQAAAQQLRAECERLVRRLDLYAPPGPLDESTKDLVRPFLNVCREYLDAEAQGHFGLRSPKRRGLFARLSVR
ncbi:hypothetical protein ACIBAC_00760 [Streptomyces sp. NPDC051362]|uniref:hypothetical protein n=1 Tax=Streptomyces sp. NPDC051362 TaxID=3365651 RepID=UPI00378D63AB